ncbi:tRNA-uridine aminocarboxypropyltransferase [Sulfurimonas sp. C5]|uniref:tRNA-uridine aminocarboxypropyltransferase n=1 Tax=Sulfurimonas sp. C5 TaxID=3036947 RepID=UPI002454721A|nr:tRNA-uridine aminocarboxypropyltransferase [Sulfurimonas sp. C5]MDH4944133.1 DTW domain-containing protein [Sulfurimonas sp. C5]
MKCTYYGDREKCYKCYRPKSSCMCEYCESINTQTKFVVLMHPKEFKKVKNNTGHFTHQSLPNSELFVGIDFSDNSRINEIIATHESYILFPSQDAVNISNENPKSSEKPLAIFIIDSTWACTKKMFTLSKNLNTLRHMSFTTEKTSQYEIKVQPDDAYLSTIESTQVVLECLNQWNIETIAQEQLQSFTKPFLQMIEYQKELIANPKSHAVRFKRYTQKI